ncbi:MAG: signal transduction histidine kinase [Sulfurimonas sp.]|uniref:sensor histidine kinase n=1 Tax=Sulfurimonas sp. TaxID=2022749 RepID=UPI0039E4200C
MLKFHQIVIRKFILIFSILFIAIGAIVYYWTKDFYITQSRDSLLNNIEILSFDIHDISHLDVVAKKIKKTLNLRLTIISADGEVMIESHKNKAKMDNHKYREEIMQSNKEPYGYKIRHSKTINKDYLYIVKKYSINGEVIYIRLAKELKNINKEIFALGWKTLFVLAIFFTFLIWITYKMSSQLEHEIQKIAVFLSALTKKEKTSYIRSDFSLEFSKITKQLTKVSQILVKKDKRKSKYTAKLQLANEQKDDIISAISHEFKNPIAVINGYSQTLMDDINLNPNIRQKFLSKIYKNGIRLSDLIDTLRLSIKLDSGQQKAQFTTVNVYEIINDTVDTMQVNYSKRQTIITGDKTISIKADASLFGIVISNLVENAYKYSEDEVIINFNEKQIDIIDTGIGISSKSLENITQKFYRVQGNSWNNSLGLGLFLVNNISKLHNFSLEVKSVENEGSTFSIKM